MPMWLAECLLLNQTPAMPMLAKVSFVLLPWNKDPDAEPLPELLNTYVFLVSHPYPFCLTDHYACLAPNLS